MVLPTSRSSLWVFVLIGFLLSTHGASAGTVDDALQRTLDEQVKVLKIPGLQAAVRVGETTWLLTSGHSDRKGERSLQSGDLLRVGSVTKLFTSALVLQLIESGRIGLDDTVDRWFPDAPEGQAVTVRQLLNHSSGIANYTESLWLVLRAAVQSQRRWTPEEILKVGFDKPLRFAPGTGHYYSNTNFVMLGLIAEQVTGRSLEQLYHDMVLSPLGLKNTYFALADPVPERLITGYDRDVIPFGVHAIDPTNVSWSTLGFSAGAMVSNAQDLLQFIDGLFTGELLSETTLAEMINYLEVEDAGVPDQLGYGLGLRCLKVEGDELLGHTGTTPGFGAAVFHCPEKDYSIALVANMSMFDQSSVLREVIRVLHSDRTN